MWTRGKDKTNAGKFSFSFYEGRNLAKTVGGFNTAQEADRAAEMEQRLAFYGVESKPNQEMSDDDILAELGL